MKNKLSLAGCVIYDENNRILLLHRNTPGRVQWETPGGKIEAGETPEITAIREIKEELGVDIEVLKEVGRRDFSEDQFVMEYIWLEAKITKGEPEPMEEKFDLCQYFPIDELEKMKSELSPNTKNLLEHIKNN